MEMPIYYRHSYQAVEQRFLEWGQKRQQKLYSLQDEQADRFTYRPEINTRSSRLYQRVLQKRARVTPEINSTNPITRQRAIADALILEKREWNTKHMPAIIESLTQEMRECTFMPRINQHSQRIFRTSRRLSQYR